MVTCKYCETERDESEFQKANVVKGKVYYRKKCTICKIKDQNARLGIIKTWVREYKKSHPCEKCGMADYRALQFHHKDDSEKDEAVAQGMVNGWSKERLMREIKKCLVLCANCHQIEHFKE